MTIRFGDLYEEIVAIEDAMQRMRDDIASSDCSSITKCRLEIELEMLEQKLYELERTNIDFELLNFVTIIESIERCFNCIDIPGELSHDIAPAPYDTASNCGGKKRQLSLKDIELIKVFEMSTRKPDKRPNAFEFVKSAMPYKILTIASEKYIVTYDSLRNGIAVKGFNKQTGESVTNFGNISRIDVKLNESARQKYGVEWVTACKVLLTTPTPMVSLAPLSLAIDGNPSTMPRVEYTNETEVEMVFQFFV
ncbi:hypothetical protein COM24_23470 [Bacillus toyonensis]|uniref:hypothetical protein n=1 Tax=Bacillus toyonensis TaxID=155322 RepID=UPI000BF3ABF1|nr:hypothetical protein [Bacillus toyonensis]PGC48742.1 hypothetical protein COM24_23470 [Bacillus toyonensis]